MTIWISREHPLFNFERLDVLCAWIGHLCEKLWLFEFLDSFCCSISSASLRTHLNRTTVWKDMNIWISQELPLFNFECLDILCARIGQPCEKLLPFEFLESFCCSMSSVSLYYFPESNIQVKSYDHLNFLRASAVQFRGLPCEKLWLYEFQESFRCSISCVSRYYSPESNIRVKSYDHLDFLRAFIFSISGVAIYYIPELYIHAKTYYHLNFSRASVVEFKVSRYVMLQNQTSEWKVMTIWISRELSFFNFEPRNILWAWIRHPCEKSLPFEFLESFLC